FFLFFFFSSRRRHTRFDCDWSSDVCSSDLSVLSIARPCSNRSIIPSRGIWPDRPRSRERCKTFTGWKPEFDHEKQDLWRSHCRRSEERRVGKEGRWWWAAER